MCRKRGDGVRGGVRRRERKGRRQTAKQFARRHAIKGDRRKEDEQMKHCVDQLHSLQRNHLTDAAKVGEKERKGKERREGDRWPMMAKGIA